jgi:lysophospholipase L1-like esterase
MFKNIIKHIKGFLPKIGLTIISFAIIFLGLEIFFRYKAHGRYTKGIQVLSAAEKNINDYVGEIQLRHIIRLSEYPKIIYELIPNLSVNFFGKSLRTNPDGFRSPPYAKQKKAEAMRIIGLGDSIMFGWGMSNDECYLARLGIKMQRNFTDIQWEVINTAVPGYNTVMEVETLKSKGLQFDPDIVIIHFVGNDTDLPNFIQKKENYWTLRKSFLVNYLTKRLQENSGGIQDPLVPAPQHSFESRFENDPKRVPDEYRDMVGEDACFQAMKELKALSRKHGFELFVVLFQAPDFVKEMCSRFNIPLIETVHKVKQTMDSLGIEQYEGSTLTISKEDPHPSALGHTIIADCIFEYFRDCDRILLSSKAK